MTTQTTIFDAIAVHELAARDSGMELAAAHGQPVLELARRAAYWHAIYHHTVTIEDVRNRLDRMLGPCCWEPGNWMGSVFKERRLGERVWAPTGRWVQATHKGGHARPVREWRLR